MAVSLCYPQANKSPQSVAVVLYKPLTKFMFQFKMIFQDHTHHTCLDLSKVMIIKGLDSAICIFFSFPPDHAIDSPLIL